MLITTSNFLSTPIDNFKDLLSDTENFNKALVYYQKTKLSFEKLLLMHTIKYGHVLYCLSVLYEMQGNNDLAGEYSRAAYTSYEKVGYNGIWKEKAWLRAGMLEIGGQQMAS